MPGADADRRLLDALADIVVKGAPYGEQDGGYVFLYLLPTGPIHRAVALLQEHGVIVRPGYDGRRHHPPEQRMTMPSIGRTVHYRSRGSADGRFQPECRAAIVTAVDTYQDGEENGQHIGHVSLAVLNPFGMFFDQGVMQDEDEKAGGTWHWPGRVESGGCRPKSI